MKKVRKELDPIDVRNRQEMIDLGLHPKNREHYDWSKTPEEKVKLQKLKRELGRNFSGGWGRTEKKNIPVPGKLVVYVWGKPTKSYKCMQHDIPDILARVKEGFTVKVTKYQWNGTTYEGNELPFWQPKVKGGPSIHLRS